MKLNIKATILLLFLIPVLQLTAQESYQDEIILDEYTTISAGLFLPIATGDNFVSKGMNVPYGFDINFDYHFRFKLFVGARYQYLRANPEEVSLVRNFDRTNVNLYAINLGYTVNISDRWNIQPVLTYGVTTYNNKKDFSGDGRGRIKFSDDATSYLISVNLNYKLNAKTHLFFKPEYRLDSTEIKAADEIQQFFESAQFLNFQFGLRMKFL